MVDQVTFTTPPTGPNPPPQDNQQQQNQRPDWMPENFEGDERALAKSWVDQRAEITRLQQELAKYTKGTPQTTPPQQGNGADSAPSGDGAGDKNPTGGNQQQQQTQNQQQDNAAKQVAEAAGFDLIPYQQEFNQTGDVSEENRAKIAEGLKSVLGENARQIVDQFIDARKVVIENDTKMYMDAAGGEENYALMTEWAKTNLSREELEAYNKQVESGDRHAVLFAIEGLRAKYEAVNGKLPNLIRGNGPGEAIVGFRSTAEMRAAMSDPRYKTDAAYREQVKRRLAASPF